MEFFKIHRDIPFMSYARVTTLISLVTFILAVAALSVKHLNFGVDFTGGTVMEVNYPHPAEVTKIRDTLTGIGLSDAAVQTFGTILDSNITTLIAGLALLIFGSGPVRGFAVVHCLGILTSIFSSVVVSRALVNLIYGRQKKLTKVAIGQIWKPGVAAGSQK